jgi:hypothetical protein
MPIVPILQAILNILFVRNNGPTLAKAAGFL